MTPQKTQIDTRLPSNLIKKSLTKVEQGEDSSSLTLSFHNSEHLGLSWLLFALYHYRLSLLLSSSFFLFYSTLRGKTQGGLGFLLQSRQMYLGHKVPLWFITTNPQSYIVPMVLYDRRPIEQDTCSIVKYYSIKKPLNRSKSVLFPYQGIPLYTYAVLYYTTALLYYSKVLYIDPSLYVFFYNVQTYRSIAQ